MSIKHNEIVNDVAGEAVLTALTLGVFKMFGAGKKRKETVQSPEGYKHPSKYMGNELIETEGGVYGEFEQFILENQSTIGIIFGSRGQGKSAMAMRILEDVHAHSGRKCMAMGFNGAALPNWIKCVKSIDELENGSFVVIDEGGVLFSARDAMSDSNKMISRLLLIARHKNLSILFITQNSANMEINTIRQADYLLMKSPAVLQSKFERPIIGKIYDGIKNKMLEYRKDYRGITYVYSDLFQGYFNNGLASFWNEDISKNFSEV